jgi:uncharacterized protein YkwD
MGLPPGIGRATPFLKGAPFEGLNVIRLMADRLGMRGTGRPGIRIFLVSLLATAALVATGTEAFAETVVQRNASEPRLVGRINIVRANHGLHALKVSDPLMTAAQRHATNMAWKAYFRHEFRKNGNWVSFGRWIRWYWPGPGYTAWTAGENLAWGSPDLSPRRTVRMWMNSPGHRANILGAWSSLGVSVVHVTRPGGFFNSYPEVTLVAAEFGRRT